MEVHSNFVSNAERLQQADVRTQAAGQQVPDGDKALFDEAMNSREQPLLNDRGQSMDSASSFPTRSTSLNGRGQGLDSAEPLQNEQPSPSSLFESMFGKLNQTAQNTQNVQSVTPQTTEIDSLVDKLVDRILTSQPGVGDPKVSLSIGSGPLAGAELSVSRAVDGQLFVQIDCPDPSTFGTAREAMDSLRTSLEKTGENNVRVEVNQDSGREEGNTDRRSRGLENESYY